MYPVFKSNIPSVSVNTVHMCLCVKNQVSYHFRYTMSLAIFGNLRKILKNLFFRQMLENLGKWLEIFGNSPQMLLCIVNILNYNENALTCEIHSTMQCPLFFYVNIFTYISIIIR